MQNNSKLVTRQQVFSYGYVIDSWASDIFGSNMSEDLVVEYEGDAYLVSVNREDGEVINPNGKAKIWDDYL